VSGVVSDASPLIALHEIGQLGLLGAIFGTVLMPPAVAREALSVVRPSWIVERAPKTPLAPAVARAGLGAGESETISLALELDADRVIIDELAGRSLALRLGLPLIGTLGILLVARRRNLIPTIREPIDTLRRGGFRVANDLYEDLLHRAGELA